MARKYILDTHALIWYLEGNKRLGEQAQAVMSNLANELVLPTIALAEAIHIISRGRTNISSPDSLMQAVQDAPHVQVAALTWEILQQSVRATAVPEMHDRLIVATAMQLQAIGDEVLLVTRDEAIAAAQLVATIW